MADRVPALPVGAHPSGRIGEDPNDIPNNLLPYIAQMAVGRLERLQVFGGDCPTSDVSRVPGLGWRHKHSMHEGLISAYEDFPRTLDPDR